MGLSCPSTQPTFHYCVLVALAFQIRAGVMTSFLREDQPPVLSAEPPESPSLVDHLMQVLHPEEALLRGHFSAPPTPAGGSFEPLAS